MAHEGAAAEILGPDLDPEKFVREHTVIANQEATAASEAGERRQKIGQLFEDMRLENKAASQARAILKMKNEGKQRDGVRSWQQLLPMLEEHILGGSHDEMDLHPNNGTDEEAAVDPVDDSYDPASFDDEESQAFADAVDETFDGDVMPFEARAAE